MNVYLAHLIGDYILQNDWMARGKKQHWVPCFAHIWVYMLPFLFCDLNILQFFTIAVQHYAQDRTNFVVWFMKAKGSAEFATGPCSPWSIIVTDNVLHVLTIAFTVKYINVENVLKFKSQILYFLFT